MTTTTANPFEVALEALKTSGLVPATYTPAQGDCLPLPKKGGGREYFVRLSFKTLNTPNLQEIGWRFKPGTVLADAIIPPGLPKATRPYSPAQRDTSRREAAHEAGHGNRASGATFAGRANTSKWNPKWKDVSLRNVIPAMTEQGYECCAIFEQDVMPRSGASKDHAEAIAGRALEARRANNRPEFERLWGFIDKAFREQRVLEDLPTKWVRLCFFVEGSQGSMTKARTYLQEEPGLDIGDGDEFLPHFASLLEKMHFGEVFGHWNLQEAGSERDELSIVVTAKPWGQRFAARGLVLEKGFLRS